MATAETARLIASLELKDKFSPGLNKAVGGLGKLEGKFNRIGGIAQKGVGNAIHNVQMLGIAGGVAIAGAVALGIRSLADLQRTEAQTAAVIASTGGKAGVSAAEIRKYAEALESVTTVDDKVIQDGENMLLTFTGIGDKVFPRATKAALNMAIAMAGGDAANVDMKASAIQLGKALNDPIKGITALSKVGVAFTKQQKDQIKAMVAAGDVVGAQTIILKELETEFGKAGEAAGKGPGASWRRLQDVGEDLSQSMARGLLPVLEKTATWLSTKLADPRVIRAVNEIGEGLGKAGAAGLAFLEKVDFGSIGAGLSVAAEGAKGLVSAFMGMPEWVKVAVITGWGLNKLTGGALGDLGKLGLKLVVDQFAARGATPANPLFVSDITKGLGGLPAAGAAGAVAAGTGIALATAIVAPLAVGAAALIIQGQIDDQGKALAAQAAAFAPQASNADLAKSIDGVRDQLAGMQFNTFDSKNKVIDTLNILIAEQNRRATARPALSGGPSLEDRDAKRSGLTAATLERAIAAGFKPTAAAVEATFARTTARQEEAALRVAEAARTAAAAIRDRDSSPPVTNVAVTVNVTAAQVAKSIVIQNRFGPSGGSRDRGSANTWGGGT